MEQLSLQISMLARHLTHIKSPQHLSHEQLPLHPSHLLAYTASGTYTEGQEALEVILGELGVVKWMRGWEPALRPVMERVVEVARASGKSEDAGLHVGLQL